MPWTPSAHQFIIALICAEGLLILTSVESLTILLKRSDQRTAGEMRRVSRGIFREFLGAFFIFVPVSVLVAMIVIRPFLSKLTSVPPEAIDGLLGTISYGFPYRAVKQWVIRASLRFLKEAVEVADKEVIEDAKNRDG